MASFLVPVLTMTALAYRGIAAVEVSIAETATLLVVLVALAFGVVLGLAAAWGGDRVRILVFSLTTVLLLDMTVHPARLFDRLERRIAAQRDAQRVADLNRLKAALDDYARTVGPLPLPASYGEGTGPETFWPGWWDVSSTDGDNDGRPFLDFLEEHGTRVPLDPMSATSGSADPRVGHQYVYFVAPSAYSYQGGACPAWANKWVYVLAVTDLETETVRPPAQAAGSGCRCLWRDAPNFFQQYFDYVLCGSFER